jgi:hypothetical protein
MPSGQEGAPPEGDPGDPRGVYLVIDGAHGAGRVDRYRRRAVRILSVWHLLLGCLAVTVDCLAMLHLLALDAVGLGLCSGLVFTATGTLGLTSLQKTSSCKITTFLVLSIISAVVGGFLLHFGALMHYTGGSPGAAMLALVGLAEVVLGSVSSAFACCACCSCCAGEAAGGPGGQVVYVASPGVEGEVVKLRLQGQEVKQPEAEVNEDGKYARFT